MASESPLIVDRGKTMPDMKTGWALVAIGKGPPRLIADGRLSISEKLFGGYSIAEVDTSSKTLAQSIKLPTRVPGIDYDADVTVTYRVADPVLAVAASAKTVWDDIRQQIWPILEEASQGTVGEAGGGDATPRGGALESKDLQLAQQRINRVCAPKMTKSLLSDIGIELRTVTAKLSYDAETKKLVQDIGRAGLQKESEAAKAGVELEARNRAEALLSMGPRGWLAEAMRLDPKMITTLLQQMSTVEQERYHHDINLLDKLISEGHIEGHHIPEGVRDEFLKSLMNRASYGDILRLGAAAENAPPPVEDKSAES